MFWPENTRSKKYGQVFTVEHVAHQHYPNIRSWVFKINKKVKNEEKLEIFCLKIYLHFLLVGPRVICLVETYFSKFPDLRKID